jgi:transposase-like protein
MNASADSIELPRTLVEAVRYFSDLHVAHSFFANMRWPNGTVCPRCGSTDVRYLADYRRYQCSSRHARRQFTVKTGTVMEDSPLGLDKWAVAFWLEANAKNSISSYEVHRALGITQKSAWFMQHRIRLAMQSGSNEKLGGVGSGGVEVDETFIGGRGGNMHAAKRKRIMKGRGHVGKTAVMGLLERHGPDRKKSVRTIVVSNIKGKKLRPLVQDNVHPGTEVFTDALQSYVGLYPEYVHQIIDHAECYVKGNVHTNGLENFWSLFKRCIKGTHVSVEPFHLVRYLDSQCFRFNNRECNDAQRFALALKGMVGKRMTYKDLTGGVEFLTASPDSDAGSAGLPN